LVQFLLNGRPQSRRFSSHNAPWCYVAS